MKESRTSLLVKRNADSGATLDVNKLEKTIVDNGIPVNSIHVSETGDTYVNLPDQKSRDKLQPLIREYEPSNEIVHLKSKLPTIALLGVTKEYPKPEIVEMIRKQNEVINTLVEKGSMLQVVFTKAPIDENPYHQVVLRVSPDIRRAINNANNKIHMGGHQGRLVHTVVDRFYIKRCNACQQFGHYQTKCPTPTVTICGYCMDDTHASKNCPKKAGPKTSYQCRNCLAADLNHQGHSTFWLKCPAYIEQQKKLSRVIDYDYDSN